jgi:hypothetical protein
MFKCKEVPFECEVGFALSLIVDVFANGIDALRGRVPLPSVDALAAALARSHGAEFQKKTLRRRLRRLNYIIAADDKKFFRKVVAVIEGVIERAGGFEVVASALNHISEGANQEAFEVFEDFSRHRELILSVLREVGAHGENHQELAKAVLHSVARLLAMGVPIPQPSLKFL